MIILDATTKTLEVDLAGAISTNQLPVTVNYVDVTTTTYTPGSSDTATNSTTAVTIVSAPAASTQRQVKLLTVYNADTASATVTIQLNNNATLRSLVVVVLAVGSTLIYTDGEGWRVLTSAGAIVTSTLSPMTSAQLATIISDETGSGALVFATSPTLVTPALGTPSAVVLTNATGLPTAGLVDAAVTLAKMANLAQDQFIGRTTASTGVPETATITAAARTVLDDATVAAMVDTLGGAAAVGTGGLARATSPIFATQISTPAIVAPAALTITPAAGSGVNIVLSTTGDFAVNTDNLVVDTSGGNVGIGTTTPGAKLDLFGDTLLNLSTNRVNSGSRNWGMYNTQPADVPEGGFAIVESTAYNTSPSVTRLVIDNQGRVGIGNATPSFTLEVNGTGRFINSVDLALTSGNVGIGVGGTNVDGLLEVSARGGASDLFLLSSNTDGNGDRFIVKNSGNVGIGTTTPDAKLNIVSTTGNKFINLETSTNVLDEFSGISFGTNPGDRTKAAIGMVNTNTGNAAGALALYTSTSSTLTEWMRITTAGNVGIGTTSPTNLLSLGGNAARIFWLERHTTANTAGNTLTVQAGGATAAATDKAGGDLILLPGASTGTGRANVRLRNYSRATATGTADNTAVDRLIVAGAVTLTDAATSMFEVALTAGASAGGCILWTIRASDGTDMQAYTGVTTFSAVNKAGVYTKTVTSDVGNDAKAVSAGTLTATFSLLDGTDKITMQITPAGSLVETTYQMAYTLFNNSPQAITIL